MSLRKNGIYQGDCIKQFSKVDDGSVDLVFADPPFNIGYDYDVYDDSQSAEEYLAWSRRWISETHRVLKPDGTFWLAIGDEYAAELKIESQKAGFHCRSWVIWYYTFGVNCQNGFSRSHTHLFHFVKDPKKFTFNKFNPQIRVKSARQLVYADARANPNGRLPDNTWITRPQDAPLSFSPNHDTWFFARVAGTFKEREGFHGCQMPEQLLARIIRASSHPQDLVLDPFTGSGTTLCVAKKLARNWMGFELSEDYVSSINKRIEKTKVGDPVDGPEDPVESSPSTAEGKRRPKPFNEKTELAVIEAYQTAGQGFPADYLLCHPELNAEFIKACLGHGIGGNATVWNSYLLRLRKSGKLPQSTKKPASVTAQEMNSFGFASEVAWRLLAIDYRKTLDEILCSPEFASEFDRLAKEFGPVDQEVAPVDFRRVAVSIRKRTPKARELAAEKFAKWMKRSSSIVSCAIDDSDAELESPGVVLLQTEGISFYATEAKNMRQQVERLMNNPNWRNLGADSLAFVQCENNQTSLYALKSALVSRESPLLNCRLLQHDAELPA